MTEQVNDEKDRQITLIDDQGNEELYEILFTFHSDDYDKSYVLLYPAAVGEDEDIEVQAFSYDADDAGWWRSADHGCTQAKMLKHNFYTFRL